MDVYIDNHESPRLLLFTAGTMSNNNCDAITAAIDSAYQRIVDVDASDIVVSWDLRNADAPAIMLPRLILNVTSKFLSWNDKILQRVKVTRLLITSDYIRNAFLFALSAYPHASFKLVATPEELYCL